MLRPPNSPGFSASVPLSPLSSSPGSPASAPSAASVAPPIPLGHQHPSQGSLSPLAESPGVAAAYPLGAHLHGDGASVTFAVFSRHATRMLLEVYSEPVGADALYDYWLIRGDHGLWHLRLTWQPDNNPPPAFLTALRYGLRCWGPNWDFSEEWRRGGSAAGFIADVDGEGHRFNPNKLLIDPYAREFSHDKESPEVLAWGHHGGAYGSGGQTYAGIGDALPPRPRREVDTGPLAPKGLFIQDSESTGDKPHIGQKDTILYEAHVRGLTQHPSSSRLRANLAGIAGFEGLVDLPAGLRGTYLGAGYMAKYLKAMGFTTLELLPVHECANDGNYWGYMTCGFFAPDARYATSREPGAATREFKRMIKAFHDEGMEIYLDVVYNHHGEGGLWPKPHSREADPDTADLLSLRGLDNAQYYALTQDKRYYWDSTGCGNNLDGSKAVVQKLIHDSLLYWAKDMGVDGFRFDLATVLGRHADAQYAFSSGSGLLKDIAALAKEHGFEIVAEAWDTSGHDGYQVGRFPPGWAEWNGHYRDHARRYLKGMGDAKAFIESLNGDYHRFADQGGPHKSVNFITAHDGFTLLDLVSYNAKNNGIGWPFGPSQGGSNDNDSWDSGGDAALRRQRLRNFLAVLLLSRGIPMLVGGDEYGRTQNGNNNPYQMDTPGLWQNWDMAGTCAPTRVPVGGWGEDPALPPYHDNYGQDGESQGRNGLLLFTRFLIALRKEHPCLRQDTYADLSSDSGGDVTFVFKREDGLADIESQDRRLFWRIDGSESGDKDFLVFLNMDSAFTTFAVPAARMGHSWLRRADTATWAEGLANFWPLAEATVIVGDYRVHPMSLVVLEEG